MSKDLLEELGKLQEENGTVQRKLESLNEEKKELEKSLSENRSNSLKEFSEKEGIELGAYSDATIQVLLKEKLNGKDCKVSESPLLIDSNGRFTSAESPKNNVPWIVNLAEGCISNAKEQIDKEGAKAVIVPINVGMNHWNSMLISKNNEGKYQAVYIDPRLDTSSKEGAEKKGVKISDHFEEFLKKQGIEKVIDLQIPQQVVKQNPTICGPYLVDNMTNLSNNLDKVNSGDIGLMQSVLHQSVNKGQEGYQDPTKMVEDQESIILKPDQDLLTRVENAKEGISKNQHLLEEITQKIQKVKVEYDKKTIATVVIKQNHEENCKEPQNLSPLQKVRNAKDEHMRTYSKTFHGMTSTSYAALSLEQRKIVANEMREQISRLRGDDTNPIWASAYRRENELYKNLKEDKNIITLNDDREFIKFESEDKTRAYALSLNGHETRGIEGKYKNFNLPLSLPKEVGPQSFFIPLQRDKGEQLKGGSLQPDLGFVVCYNAEGKIAEMIYPQPIENLEKLGPNDALKVKRGEETYVLPINKKQFDEMRSMVVQSRDREYGILHSIKQFVERVKIRTFGIPRPPLVNLSRGKNEGKGR